MALYCMHRQRQTQFRKLFRYQEDIPLQSSKMCVRVVNDTNFSLDWDIFIFFNYCYWVCKHTQVPFLPN